MSDEKSIVNFGDLSKPATVLIEKMSGAIGTVYEPTRIKREASAKAEAAKIEALANIEVSEIEQRAISRLVHEEAKKQENIESITEQATASLNDEAKPENIEDDWISHFFEKCRNVSDKEMQGLWSSLLTGEANKPGSFSKRTIELISTLDKSDAHLFTRLCSFAMAGGEFFPMILDHQAEIYKRQGINFGSLSHLDSLGLISFNHVSGFLLQSLPKNVTLLYFGMPVGFTFKSDSNNKLEIGNVMLTQVGQQLAPICGATLNPEFLNYITEHYKKKGIEVGVMIPNK
ncbi:DUF2806 domain-containing protein [Marinobacterium sp. AK62]|uniref:DUF2806 domain-containing protein n=1 Tax=Marinobacterium alkalitolerans TaxID=1542925 RepID=A0ABS3ZES5_9GAMM|nr:DUF2806 domain-containing protein [Marinobacterium alkalitolerans]MBP0050210.1 DUF2806 domain-containing protein [Marinobacterium alkalitolerans]